LRWSKIRDLEENKKIGMLIKIKFQIKISMTIRYLENQLGKTKVW
jgi:hypothetical protein